MKQLNIHPCEKDVGAWLAGEFIDYGKIAVWAKEDSRCFIYHLSSRWVWSRSCDVEVMSCDCVQVYARFGESGNKFGK